MPHLGLDCTKIQTFAADGNNAFDIPENLISLSMTNCGIRSLDHFPSIPTLRRLILSDNAIKGGLVNIVQSCPQLESLALGGNHIKVIEDLFPLKELTHLKRLELTYCPITNIPEYRNSIFEIFPDLVTLDGISKEGDYCESEEEFEEEEDFSDEEEDAEGLERIDMADFYNNDASDGDPEEGDFEPGQVEEEDEDFVSEDEEEEEGEKGEKREREANVDSSSTSPVKRRPN